MRTILNLILVCILLTCQQHIAAQSYHLGEQKSSFAYRSLYANPNAVKVVKPAENIEYPSDHALQIQNIASNEDIEKTQRYHKQLNRLETALHSAGIYTGKVYSIYNKIYKSTPQTKEDIEKLLTIQTVVLLYLNSNATEYPDLEKQLTKASSVDEQVKIFLSYSK